MKRTPYYLSLLCLAIISCNQNEDPTSGPTVEDNLPPAAVNLPPVPEFDVDRPVRHPDGAFSIWGLSQRRDESLNSSVAVSGIVREIYICEHRTEMDARDRRVRYGETTEADGTGEGTDRCNYPHLFIVDEISDTVNLLVTGYDPELEPYLIVGERYRFEGRYLEETAGFNRAGAGLIYALDITGGALDLRGLEGEVPAETESDSIIVR